MSDVFIGEVRPFAINYTPQDWFPCDGRSLPISQYQALFTVIGTVYGGTTTTFNLPDLRGYAVVGSGQGPGLSPYALGAAAGTESVTVTTSELPLHNHTITIQMASPKLLPTAFKATPTANVSHPSRLFDTAVTPAASFPAYHPTPAPGTTTPTSPTTPVAMASQALPAFIGGGDAHENRQPFTGINFCISNTGYYPLKPT